MKKAIYTFMIIFLVSCWVDDDGINCTMEARAGLNVTVKDAATNNYMGVGVTVIATDGAYSETLQFMEGTPPSFAGAWERNGNYVITVSAEGYETYISEVITVTSDECHVIPQQVEVLMQPE